MDAGTFDGVDVSAPIPGAGWPGGNIVPTAPGMYPQPPQFYFGADNPPHPDLLQNANAYFGKGLANAKAYVYDLRRPMLAQLDYQWAGTYLKKMWDPLPFYRGYPAGPALTPQRLGIFVRSVPMHNELGYQNVMLNDKGVPIAGEPYSTPQYVFAGPIQAGYMDFVRPIADRRTLPQFPKPYSQITQAQRAAMYGVYGGGPYTRPPVQPVGWATEGLGIQGDWPLYQVRPGAMPPYVPQVVQPCSRADNPGFPPQLTNAQEYQTMHQNPVFDVAHNWVSPNQMARTTMQNPFGNPMVGSGPGYHGYVSNAMQGMGTQSGYTQNPVQNPPPGQGYLLTSPTVARCSSDKDCKEGYACAGGICLRTGVTRRARGGWFRRRPYTTVGTLRQNPGGTFLARRQVVPNERALFNRLFGGGPVNAGVTRPVANPITPDVRGGVVPLGVYPRWSGQRKPNFIAKALNPDACCDSCAMGGTCEGDSHDHGPRSNPCGCGGPKQNPCGCGARPNPCGAPVPYAA